MRKKRFLSILLSVCLMMTMLPPLIMPASAALSELYVGGTNVVNGSDITYWLNDGSGGITSVGANDTNYNVKYVPGNDTTGTTDTLTLSGAAISKLYSDYGNEFCIGAGSNLNIVLNGSKSVICPTTAACSYGVISVTGNIIISGDGILEVTGGESTVGDSVAVGCTDLYIDSSGSKLIAKGGIAKNNSYGIKTYDGSVNIYQHGTIEATGGEASEKDSAGINSKSVIVAGTGQVIAKGGKATKGNSYGIQIINSTGKLYVAGEGTVDATGGEASEKNSIGIYCESLVQAYETGKITATGGKANKGISCGIFTKKSSSSNAIEAHNTAEITALGGEAVKSYGIYGIYDTLGDLISTNNNSSVTAIGGNASDTSCGVGVQFTTPRTGFTGVWMAGGNITSYSTSTTAGTTVQAINVTPKMLESYSGLYYAYNVTASNSSDGSSPVTYNESNINTYKYIKLNSIPKSSPPYSYNTTVAKTTSPQAVISFTVYNTFAGSTYKVYADNSTSTTMSSVTASLSGSAIILTSSETDIAAGTYYVSQTESGKAESNRLALTVTKYLPPAQTPATTFSFDGGNANKLMHTTSQMKYSLNGGTTWTSCTEGNTDLSSRYSEIKADKDIKVKDIGDGSTTAESAVQTIDITTGENISGVTAVNCSNAGNNNGKLTGVTIDMEYMLSTSSTWIPGTGNDIEGLTPGNYFVRTKAKGTVLAGGNNTRTIMPYTPTSAAIPNIATNLSTLEQVVSTGSAVSLSIAANTSEGALSYQWYSNTTNSSIGGTIIAGATSTAYNCTASSIANTTVYYYCVVTNTNGSHTSTATSSVTPIRTKNNTATIASFGFTSPSTTGTINNTGNTVTVTVPFGTVVTALTPSVILTDTNASISPAGIQSFSTPKTYTVTAEDGTTKVYTVTVNIAPQTTGGSDSNTSSSGSSSGTSSTPAYVPPVITVSEVKSKLFGSAEDVKVEADVNNAFGQSITVKITDTTESQKEILSLTGSNDKAYPFDISLYSNTNGTKVQPKEGYSVKITIPVPQELLGDREKIKVVYGKDGKLETLKSQLFEKDGKWYISFEAVHFSPYALVVSKEQPVKTWTNPFNDVKQNDWFYSAVQYASQNGVMNGTANNTFSPGVATSRGMIATILYKLSGSKETELSTFKDVSSDAYYAKAIAWAQKKGIITGYGNGMFGPDDIITREQLASILWKYAGSPVSADSKGLAAFKDAGEISSYAVNALTWANQAGIISGKGDNLLDPKGKATRAEAAQIIINFLKNTALKK